MDFNSHMVVFVSDKLSIFKLFVRNRTTQGRHVASGLKPQVKKLKLDAQTQVADVLQAISVLYMKLNWRLYLNIITFHGRGVASEFSTPMIPLRLRARDMQHFETKTI